MKIALVVGHELRAQGGSNVDGTTEYMFNDKLAQMIAPLLINAGLEPVIVYRNGVSYRRLPKRINNVNPDLTISLHCNAFNRKATGSEVLHFVGSERSAKLAGFIQKEVVKALGLSDRGLRPVNTAHKGRKGDRGGWLCKKTLSPTVIVEPFFIDNNQDLATARGKLQELAQAITNGVLTYEKA
ncbi:N-acetylmuramoyl-L-alanine amidase family protein [Vibrio harveyi]|uniref:N-acetylmuramoyl-L-alanine amidase family protein n=1 Tax=Vibrio harveyi TaxID=669 RepID=UPI00034D7EF5|nr:N-acetylmuramoyl-L-alanine amidase [Vibrio harveyi]